MKFTIILLLALIGPAAAQKPIIPGPSLPPAPPAATPQTQSRPRTVPPTVAERLRNYLEKNELTPAFIVNNPDAGPPNDGIQTIRFANQTADHTIKWFHKDGNTKIEIDGDVFGLAGEKTLNPIEDERRNDVDFADDWNQIRLYQTADRELLTISMINSPCTGTGCSVWMILIYDLKTKTKNFFGTYRITGDVRLYDFKSDGRIDFLSATYVDRNPAAGGNVENVFRLFTMDDAGRFNPQIDERGREYFLKRVYKADYLKELDRLFAQNWFEEIR